jgi:hypothetical protein
MIERFLYLRPTLKRLLAFGLGNIQKFPLLRSEWELLQRLVTILNIFVDPTVQLSGSKYPTLHLQLPWYLVLLKRLSDFVTEEEGRNLGDPTLLSEAYDEGWVVLNEWWKKTDDQTSLVISMILDPQCKLTGLERLGWTAAQMGKAKDAFERIYNARYTKPEVPAPPEAARPNGPAPEVNNPL